MTEVGPILNRSQGKAESQAFASSVTDRPGGDRKGSFRTNVDVLATGRLLSSSSEYETRPRQAGKQAGARGKAVSRAFVEPLSCLVRWSPCITEDVQEGAP